MSRHRSGLGLIEQLCEVSIDIAHIRSHLRRLDFAVGTALEAAEKELGISTEETDRILEELEKKRAAQGTEKF